MIAAGNGKPGAALAYFADVDLERGYMHVQYCTHCQRTVWLAMRKTRVPEMTALLFYVLSHAREMRRQLSQRLEAMEG